jgi:hypothetical protein
VSFSTDIPLDLAARAHAGTSFVPEQRAAQERASYAATLTRDFEFLREHAAKGGTSDLFEAEFARYREGYRAAYLRQLVAKSRCISWGIAGPSNFPVRKANRASSNADRRTSDLIEFRSRALAAMRRALRPDLRPIMAGDADAIHRLRVKLEKLELLQAKMVAANRAIRANAKRGPEAQVAALVALGIAPVMARELLAPDFDKRVGYADYEIKNNGAQIRAIAARLAALEAAAERPVTVEVVSNGIAVEENPAENRIRIVFPGKPAAAVIADLKSHGFRWAPSQGAWSGYINDRTRAFAARVGDSDVR